jgi:chromosome segregation ATPase
MKDLEERSKLLRRSHEDAASEQAEDQQIERLKSEIERTTSDTRRVEEDSRVLKEQLRSLETQYRLLEEVEAGLAGENRTKRQRIQLRDENLVERENELDSLQERRNCNEIVIEELRADITRLASEEEQLRAELERIRLQRQEEEREREKLRTVVGQLRREVGEQEAAGREYRAKVAQMREATQIVKEELVTLLRLEDKLKSEAARAGQQHLAATQQETHSLARLRQMEDELALAEEDIRLLTDEYIRESQSLRQEELSNQQLNAQMDCLAKQAFASWEAVRQLVAAGEGEARARAHRLWAEIARVLAVG